jgi:hypothetical protein
VYCVQSNDFTEPSLFFITFRRTIAHRSFASKPLFVKADSLLNERGKLLSDPATYPLLVILGMTVGMFAGFGIYYLETAPDLRFNPEKRNTLLRYWTGRDTVQKHSESVRKHKHDPIYDQS